MMWKIVGVLKVSVLYIYIDKRYSNRHSIHHKRPSKHSRKYQSQTTATTIAAKY